MRLLALLSLPSLSSTLPWSLLPQLGLAKRMSTRKFGVSVCELLNGKFRGEIYDMRRDRRHVKISNQGGEGAECASWHWPLAMALSEA